MLRVFRKKIKQQQQQKKQNNNIITMATAKKKPKQYSIMYSEVSGVYTLYLIP